VEALRAEISGAAGPGRVLLPALFGLPVAALAIWADRCLYKATRPVFALPGEIYDERQARLVRAATMRARWIAYAVLAVMTALGAADVALGAILGAALAGFALLLSGPQLALAWTLDPADFSPDAEDENA